MAKTENTNFGTRLKDARVTKKMTQQQLADAVGVDPKYISALENGRRNMSKELAMDMERLLGVRHEYLLGFDNHPNSAQKMAAERYSQTDLMNYMEFFFKNGYELITPFGETGDTATLTFLSHLTTIHILQGHGQYYKITNNQLHNFFKSTNKIISTLEFMLIEQFFTTTAQVISEEEVNAEFNSMSKSFKEKYGKIGQQWLEEQLKIDNCDFENVDKNVWQEAIEAFTKIELNNLSEKEAVQLLDILKNNKPQ